MASTEVERPVAVDISTPERAAQECLVAECSEVVEKKEETPKTEKTPEKRKNNNHHHGNQYKRFRNDNDNRHFKFGRKRSHSFTGGNAKFGPSHKRWKRGDFIVPPTKFLLGGNICDPLNLNSLQDEEINRAMNAVTPQSSPLPTPRHRKETIEVLIPPNIHDPLNLTAPDDDPNYELRLISPKKKKPRHRRRKSSTAAATVTEEAKPADTVKMEGADKEAETPKKADESSPEKVEKKPARRSNEGRNNERRPRRSLDDKIVSPVIPQPGAWKRPFPVFNRNLSWDHGNRSRKNNSRNRNKNRNKSETQETTPVFKPGNARFQYGNYNRYYGYRNPNQEVDVRMKCFRRDMFYGKEVLDIGCNVGHVTLAVAQQFGARRVIGIDIDRKLIKAARLNMRHYASCQPAECDERFPACMPVLYGALDAPVATGTQALKFPHNVSFTYGNYVLENDVLLGLEKPQFDVILCLSVTKWLHLNFGDDGLKRAFRRMHAQLRPGGKLILEAQAWSSYGNKKKLTKEIYENYKSIKFFPPRFTEYLLSSEVGFSKCQVIGTPQHHSRGFQRPIQMFSKAELPHNSPSETVPSTACGDAALPTETSVIRTVQVMPVQEDVWDAESPDYMPLDQEPEVALHNVNVEPEPDKTPESEANRTPGSEANKTPGSEANRTPSSEAGKTPGSEANRTPSSEAGKTPGSEANRTPGSEAEKNLASEANRTPSSDDDISKELEASQGVASEADSKELEASRGMASGIGCREDAVAEENKSDEKNEAEHSSKRHASDQNSESDSDLGHCHLIKKPKLSDM